MHRPKIFQFLALLWTVVITVLSLITISIGTIGSSIPIENKDKIVHFLFYFLFVLLWNLAQNIKTTIKIISILIVAIFYGAIIEILQSFTAIRTADFFDFLANTLGAVLGTLICLNMPKKCKAN